MNIESILNFQNGMPLQVLAQGGRTEIRMDDVVDAYTDTLWDTARYSAAALTTTPFELFTVPTGNQQSLANVSGTTYQKSQADTNLLQSRTIPDNESFVILGISARIRNPLALATTYASTAPNVPYPSALTATTLASAVNQIDALLSTTRLALKIQNKIYDDDLLECFPTPFGVDGFGMAATTASTTTIVDGIAQNVGPCRLLAVPHLIQGGTTFSVTLTNTIAFTLISPVFINVKLHGIRFRQVQ